MTSTNYYLYTIMKKLLFILVGWVCMTAAMADDTYSYLTFVCSDGSATSLGTKDLTLTVQNQDNLTAENSDETKTFTLSNLAKMYFSSSAETNTLKGDVNRDGKVDISDIVAIINQIAGTASYEDADVNSDKGVDISDIVAVINIIAGTDDSTSGEESSSVETTDTIQTLNICIGNVIYQYRSEEVDTMTFENGTTLTVLDKVFTLSEVSSMYVDNSEVIDNEVNVIYADNAAKVYIPGNIALNMSATESASHVVMTQGNVSEEVTYNLSGVSDNGSFYMTGSYKASLDLRGLTLTNPNGAAINIQDGKRIAVSVKKDTENTLKDGSESTDKGCFIVKGHTEFKGKGTLNVYAYGSAAHGIKSGEYIDMKNCTINVLAATKDGVHCAEYLLMESGELNVSGVGDDCVQVELDGTESTGVTTDHEDEDSGNIYILDGTMVLSPTADAVKGMKSAGDIEISGGNITVNQTGSITTTDTDISYPTSIKADGNINITGGTINITNTADGGKGISAEGTLNIDESNAATNITIKANGKGGTAENVNSGGSTGENSYKVYISLPATGGGGMGPGGSGNSVWKNPVLYNSSGTMIATLTNTVTKTSGNTTTTFYYYDFKDADTSVTYYIKGDDYTSRGGGGWGGGGSGTTYTIISSNFSAPTSGTDIYYSISNSYTTSGTTRTYSLSNVTNTYSGSTDASEDNGTGYNAIGLKADGNMTIGGGTIEISNSGEMSKSIKSKLNVYINGGTLTLKPSGTMQVINNDASYSSGIKCDDLEINGGTVKMTVSGNAGRGISAKNVITNGGELTITNSGAGVSGTSDTYTAKCIKADTSVKLIAGTITLTASGTGGKGIKSAGTYTQGTSDGNGPTLKVTTSGSSLSGNNSGGWGGGMGPGQQQSNGGSSAKGIKVMGTAVIYGGESEIYTSTDGAEGLESKTYVDIQGGKHYFKCYDDCINSAGCIYFNGGVTVCWSNGNDAVDSNYGKTGAITIGNGIAFAYTTKGSPEEGFDCDNNSYIQITGTGIGLSAGGAQGGGSSSSISNAKQGYYFCTSTISYSANTYYTLADASGNNLVTYSLPTSVSSTLALFTAKGMVKGSKYYLWSSTSAPTDATTAFHGLYIGSSTKGSTEVKVFKDSNTSVNYFTAQ